MESYGTITFTAFYAASGKEQLGNKSETQIPDRATVPNAGDRHQAFRLTLPHQVDCVDIIGYGTLGINCL